MIKNLISSIIITLLVSSCVKSNISTFGKGVSIGFDPRTVGMQIDDIIMQKSLVARLSFEEKKIFFINTSRDLGRKNIFNRKSK